MSSSLAQLLGVVKRPLNEILNLPSKLEQVLGINKDGVDIPTPTE